MCEPDYVNTPFSQHVNVSPDYSILFSQKAAITQEILSDVLLDVTNIPKQRCFWGRRIAEKFEKLCI